MISANGMKEVLYDEVSNEIYIKPYFKGYKIPAITYSLMEIKERLDFKNHNDIQKFEYFND